MTKRELARDLEMADGCLDMVRGDLEAFGLDMDGCPPMFYNDALRNLVARLAKYAGLHTTDDVRAVVRRRTALVPVRLQRLGIETPQP